MVSKRVKTIIEEIAREEGVPTKVVTEVVRSTFKFVADTMKKGDRENWKFKSVDVPGLGVFNLKPSFTEKIRKAVEAKRKLKEDGN